MSSPPELRLYNTLTRKKARFEPIDPRNVRVYACGPTVYDHLHIGNGRMLVVFDVLFRVLRHLYGADHVTYVRNITDVDDKINERAAERGIGIRALTDEMIAVFQADAKALGCLEPTLEPRATDHIGPMLEIVGKLIERGHAYAAERHVLFDVPSDPDYGKLSRRPLHEMIAGARVEVAPYKRSPTDFVLWKPSGPGEPAWDSPWGRGRPGWHLECSAMSWKHLGEIFDIHGGGIDLVFPHHENEIAQTCSAFGHDVMANYWMHNGHLQVEGEKMSKSLGNFVTIHELLHTDKFGGRSWPGEVLRLALLRTHYRQPIDFTVKALEEAERILDEWYRQVIASLRHEKPEGELDVTYLDTLADDFNTPAAVARLHWLYDYARTVGGSVQLERKYKFRDSARAIGLLRETADAWFASRMVNIDEEDIKSAIEERLAARAAKNWQESDRIRDELAAMGIALKDNKDGTTTWEVKR
ncbi:MAG: cysteinyl-tRNA synthetase [Methylobacteriaceae bacterium]|jgi:cysteinyl-tRNA synthetase|nr:cysteinyl-tRNA synthetase [Methylobacteriaceae bacterium]